MSVLLVLAIAAGECRVCHDEDYVRQSVCQSAVLNKMRAGVRIKMLLVSRAGVRRMLSRVSRDGSSKEHIYVSRTHIGPILALPP